MNDLFHILLVNIIILNFVLLASSRVISCINVLSLHGVVISLLPLVLHKDDIIAFLPYSLLILVVKGIIFPWLLKRALRTVNAKREVEPIVGFSASILIGLSVLLLSFWISYRLDISSFLFSRFVVSTAIFTITTGLFVLVARIKAITQVVGYVVFENGIYLFGTGLNIEQNVIIELGIILDLLVFVLLSGIIVFRINREFDHIDTHFSDFDDDKILGVKK